MLQMANQPHTSIYGCKQCNSIVSLQLLYIESMFGVGNDHWSTSGDVSRASAINEPITGSLLVALDHPIVLDPCGGIWSSPSRWFCRNVGSLGRIAGLLAQSLLRYMTSQLAMTALPQILPFPIVLIISLMIYPIPLWTSAPFNGFTAITTITTFATLLCKEQSFRSEPIHSLDCSLISDKLGDNLIGGGGHCGVFVYLEAQEEFTLVVSWDSAKEAHDVLLLTYLGDWLWIHIGVPVGSISAIGRCCCWSCEEIVILDFLIDLQYVVVDISVVLKLDASKILSTLEDDELQPRLVC